MSTPPLPPGIPSSAPARRLGTALARELKAPRTQPAANPQGEMDLRPIVQRLLRNWYWLLASMAAFLLLAFVYVKTSPNVFQVRATLLLGDQPSGSRKAEEVLELLEMNKRGVNVDDEIGLIKSYQTVQKAMERLDFAVSYFEIEDNIFNKFGEFQVIERYRDFPFRVILNPAANQVTGLRLYVRLIPPGIFELTVKGEDVKVYNLQTRQLVHRLPEVNYTKKIPFNKPYQDEYLNFKLVMNEEVKGKTSSKYFFVINDLTALTNQYLAKVEAKPIQRESHILEITSEGAIVEKEASFLNTLTDVLIENDLEEKNRTGLRTLEFIDSQIGKFSDSLRQAETALSSFRSTSKVLDVGQSTNNIYQKLDGLEQEKSRLSVQLQYYQNVLKNMQSEQQITNVVSPGTLGIDNPILNQLLIELMGLNRQMAGLGVVAKSDAPNVRTLEAKIKNANQALQENLINNINSVRIAQQDLNGRIGELEGNIFRMPENERRLQDLQGKAGFNKSNYNYLLEKRVESAIQLAANTPDKKRVDTATMVGGGPKSPKSKQIYMIALLAGLIIPAGLIVFRERFDDTVQSKDDVEAASAIPFLGIITQASRTMKLPVVEKPLSAISESFRSVRINLQYLAAGMDKKVIGITSSISGEGKTFCSANLAAEIALSGKKVLVIETDLRRPTLKNYFKVGSDKGLSSYLIRQSTLKETIQATEVKGLDVILSGPIPPNPVELISLPAMEELIEKAKETYDYVLLDIPPISFVSEYYILLRHLDANLFITRYKYTSKNLLQNIDALYREGKIDHIYTVLNGLNYYQKYEYRKSGEKYYRG